MSERKGSRSVCLCLFEAGQLLLPLFFLLEVLRVHVSLEGRPGQMREQLRVPEYLEEQVEQFLLAFEVPLEALTEYGSDQVSNLVRVLRVNDEDPVHLVHDDDAEHGPDGQCRAEVEGEERGVREKRVGLKVREDLQVDALLALRPLCGRHAPVVLARESYLSSLKVIFFIHGLSLLNPDCLHICTLSKAQSLGNEVLNV
jgi:hypothetical protein